MSQDSMETQIDSQGPEDVRAQQTQQTPVQKKTKERMPTTTRRDTN